MVSFFEYRYWTLLSSSQDLVFKKICLVTEILSTVNLHFFASLLFDIETISLVLDLWLLADMRHSKLAEGLLLALKFFTVGHLTLMWPSILKRKNLIVLRYRTLTTLPTASSTFTFLVFIVGCNATCRIL